jgi:hypothetical protein
MNITVAANGDISIDTNGTNPKEVVALLNEFTKNQGLNNQQPSLNDLQYETWEYLVENDCKRGVAVAGLARDKDVTNGTASQRMITLARGGHAYRVSSGHYRANM